MPTYEVTSPDGKTWEVSAPEGATQEQVLSYAKQHWSAQQKSEATPPKQEPDSLGRQAGLFARSTLSAAAGIPQMVTEPIRQLLVNPASRQLGGPEAAPLTKEADKFSDWLGLPTPRNATERIVGKGVEMGMGSAGMAGAARLAGNVIQSPAIKSVLDTLSSNPGTQAVAGAGAGLAGQHSKERGGGSLDQFTSSVLGSLAGAGGMAVAKGAANWAGNLVKPGLKPQIIDQRVTNILVQSGVDPQSIGPAMLAKMREDVARAMRVGGSLDERAVERLADYARVGATPRRGGVTLDPFDVTMQQNAEKIAAATGARDARLPAISQANNRQLIHTVEGMGPNPDSYAAGSSVVSNILGRDASMGAAKKALYDQARGMAGGDIPVDRGAFTNAAFEGLARENKMAFLPENISKMLNQISVGTVKVGKQTHEVPFNVDTIDMLKTMLATESRNTANGNTKAALKIVRDALENVPISPTKANFGGSQLVTAGGAQTLQGADAQAGNLLEALNRARGAARQQFAWQESAPGIEAALAGNVPVESFIKRHIISSAAGADDVARLVGNLDAPARDAVRGNIVQHLLESATSKGREASASNFNGPALSSALKSIGDRKLALFFSPEEIESLKSAARVGGYETFQPRGSAVNNSNTGAAMANLLQGISKYAKPFAKAVPFGEAAISSPLDYLTLRSMESPVLNISGGLLTGAPQKGSFAAGLLAPALYGGGLLAAPGR